uniref:Uncharacterized protein n=1 Tax=Peronospora matthiolae TaxID=2874970 RepID=A0AAV1V1S7_9STRA
MDVKKQYQQEDDTMKQLELPLILKLLNLLRPSAAFPQVVATAVTPIDHHLETVEHLPRALQQPATIL